MSLPRNIRTYKRAYVRTGAVVLVAAGLTISGVAIYNLTLGETQVATEQQQVAEVTPLIVAEPEIAIADHEFEIGEVFAKFSAPRLGVDYVRNIAEGTGADRVLNTVGIGHYVSTQMPGEVGNFALAGHRAGNGGPFRNIDKFVAGDLAYIETAEGVFTYEYLDQAVVAPTALGVIAPVPADLKPELADANSDLKTDAGGKYLTLTTCTPIYVNTDRLIVWFKLVDFAPAGSADTEGTSSGQ